MGNAVEVDNKSLNFYSSIQFLALYNKQPPFNFRHIFDLFTSRNEKYYQKYMTGPYLQPNVFYVFFGNKN
jgi:hypothetical protein